MEQGLTYNRALEMSKDAVNLDELGIEGGIRFKKAVLGATILELPGDISGQKVDLL